MGRVMTYFERATRNTLPLSLSLQERDTDEERWYQFNDVLVEPFDPKDIQKNCFGGTEAISHWDPLQRKNVKIFVPKVCV